LRMEKYITHWKDLVPYTPPGHSKTTNYRLLGPGGSDRMEVILGQIEYGGQADHHVHPDLEQAFFVLGGKAVVEIAGETEVVGPDDFVYFPPGTPHRITPLEGSPLRILIIYSPPLLSGGKGADS
jgi:mannose-6-phosphate isomerase-like protein (cupin superfamily)